MVETNLETAKIALGERERIREKYLHKYIGYWTATAKNDFDSIDVIEKWASAMNLDAVIWTALPPKFDGQTGRIPTADEVISFLRNLPQEKNKNAEEYIRRAPRQIDTHYRRRIEAELNWTPFSEF